MAQPANNLPLVVAHLCERFLMMQGANANGTERAVTWNGCILGVVIRCGKIPEAANANQPKSAIEI